ncbi:hypothetical protein EVAR_21642_1 [Eumeta japonica]|uniref:Uncharacterized protein n=1 Tax=Eumeta variegata TaxID=151549 RepID=A0A4C1VGW0_EUMVA|nr:hypothetical protein EVAR_21642_1 [Eumeta japonica]
MSLYGRRPPSTDRHTYIFFQNLAARRDGSKAILGGVGVSRPPVGRMHIVGNVVNLESERGRFNKKQP